MEVRKGLLAQERPEAVPALRLRNAFRSSANLPHGSFCLTTLTSWTLPFAKTALHMPSSSLILLGVFAPSAGILGAFVWPAVQRRLQLNSLRVLMLLVVAASLFPLYGVIGLFAPRGAKATHAALYAEIIIPPGEDAHWYGPLVVGLVADSKGNTRYGFWFLVVMLWAALPVLTGVDVERGRIDARAWSSGDDGLEAEGGAVAHADDGR
ncbi:hypothetical protein EI94DRAFT_1810005 [Lactarius quietus]|nr:hypothetical protein EI94DRAFT_1810005 [Lactarius quietus]